MAIQFEDILSALCSEVSLGHANESQKLFLLNDAKEAKLACEVLNAHGFDAKIYPEDSASKLYITLPPPDPATEQKLSAALAYAGSLKQIKHNMDTLCRDNAAALQSPDYSMVFANMPHAGKQIVISLAPARSGVTPPPSPRPAAPSAANAVKSPKTASQSADKAFFYGPSVGEKSHIKHYRSRSKSNSAWSQIYNYLYGHAEATIYGMVIGIIFLIMVIAFFTFARAYLCPDFAVAKKNTAWYCRSVDSSQ